MKELSPLKCMRCEGEWVPKVENPRQCPLCKSPLWNTPYRRGPKKPPVSVPKSEHYIKDTSEQEVVASAIKETVEEMEEFCEGPLSYAEQVKLAIERMRK